MKDRNITRRIVSDRGLVHQELVKIYLSDSKDCGKFPSREILQELEKRNKKSNEQER